jgi:hypothetical protein
MNTILAAPDLLRIEKISFRFDEAGLAVKTWPPKSACPSCGWQSDKAHSRYQRHLADLPWEGVAVKLILSARKFFRLNPDCRRRIFCERLPGLAAPVEIATSCRTINFSEDVEPDFIGREVASLQIPEIGVGTTADS